MTLAFSAEQDELGRVTRELLAERSPEAEVRRLMETTDGYDPKVWAELASLGLTGLAVPEELGGAGASFIEVGIVCEEAGRALLCAPYLSTVVLATTALLASGDPAAQADYLPPIAAGELRATLAHAAAPAPTVTATPDGAGWRLDGTVSYVLDGHTADLILIPAALAAPADGTPDGVDLFAVAGDAAGLTRAPLATLDLTRKQAQLDLAAVPARRVGPAGAGPAILRRVLAVATVGLAAEQTGGAGQILDLTVEYAKTRIQFGRPIGSFQAVKHKCADMLVRVESARSAAYRGMSDVAAVDLSAIDLDDTALDDTTLDETAAIAGAYCSEAFLDCAADAIQLHGGIGFTWEHPAQLYFKRARTSHVLFGDPRQHRAALARRL